MDALSSIVAEAPPLIRLVDIAKSFATGDAGRGATAALRGITLDIGHGEIVGIAGSSGAGKSTLLRIINLLETPDRGSVIVGGRDLTRLSRRALREARQGIGMIFQHYNLLQNLTVADNVGLPLRLRGGLNAPRVAARVRECLELVGLADKAGAYPARLSGGQRQRVAIARALAGQPAVLLCDEPTSALDAAATRALLDTLREANERLGVTIVIVSHELPALAALCRRVAVIEGGTLAETFDLAGTSAPPVTALGRELVFHRDEGAVPADRGAQHA